MSNYLLGAIAGDNSIINETAVMTRPYLVTMGDNCDIDGFFWCDAELTLGDNVQIGSHVSISGGKVSIGDNTIVGSGCKFVGNIEVGKNVKIGENAVIYEGVKIQDKQFVLPGAFVQKKDLCAFSN